MRQQSARIPSITETDVRNTVPVLFPILIILVISFAVYFNALSDGFVYDDNFQVLKNKWIKDVRYIPEVFSKNTWSFEARKEFSLSNYYRPVMHLVYMADYHLFGMRPWGFHLVNILFHAGTSIMVFLITLRLLGNARSASSRWHFSVPFLAAVLFATHPIHTEAVTWIAAFPELSFTFFCLLALYFYIRSEKGFGMIYLLSIASFLTALLCKETAVTFPFILFAYDYLLRKPEDASLNRIRRYIPYFFVIGVYFVLRFNALAGFIPRKFHKSLTTYQYIINIFPLFTQHLEKLVLPVDLNLWHVFHPLLSIFEIHWILSFVITSGFVVLCLYTFKKNKFILFCLLLIVVPLLPALYIPGISGKPFAERYLYLPSFGFVVLLALLIKRVGIRFSKLSAVIAVTILALYSAQTISRNLDWKDDFTLYTDTVRKSPDAYLPHYQLGAVYAKMGRIDQAISEFKTALKLNPELAESHNSLGIAYIGQGHTDEAISEFKAALRLRPDYTEPRYTLGIIYMRLGRLEEAVSEFRAALQLNPQYTMAHNNLGIAYARLGRLEEASAEFKTTLKLAPDNSEARKNYELIKKMINK